MSFVISIMVIIAGLFCGFYFFKNKNVKIPLTLKPIRQKKITYFENTKGDIAGEFVPDPIFSELPLDEKIIFRNEQKNGYLLEIEKGLPLGKNFHLIGTEINVGRYPTNQITINDQMISDKHFKIHISPGEMITLFDLDSTNGTLINDKKVKKTGLNSGDLIQIGHTELRFKKENK